MQFISRNLRGVYKLLSDADRAGCVFLIRSFTLNVKTSWNQWRSQVIGIGRAPAVRQPISPARDRMTLAVRTWCFGRARSPPRPALRYATGWNSHRARSLAS